MIFTNEEYADIHFCYGFCDGNAEAAVREYRRRYPNRRLPSAQVFSRTHQNFRNFGLGGNVDHNRNRQNNNNQNRILRAFDNNPRLSSRRAAHQLQISKSQILRTLRNNHKHAYHLQPVHHLHPGDPEQRIGNTSVQNIIRVPGVTYRTTCVHPSKPKRGVTEPACTVQ
ncbi:hypothetical protein NQ315_003583 [Exocentrus adspersus]|uniref:DUF4817 domain-containing protein n=1 Tax=Exocentrus adspersus TaxID=1586481 RepID=A0AAV8VJ94_9CUCU|nr:hypothetical protein NQ315_003583 [Exocentrus adspersus]